MAISVMYDVIDQIITRASEAVPVGVRVRDGYDFTSDPADYLMVGGDDPDNVDPAASASSRKEFAAVTGWQAILDEGEVTCVAVVRNGDADQRAARLAAVAIVAAVEGVLKADRSLGLPRVIWSRIGSEELMQDQTDAGAVARIVFVIEYQARLGEDYK